MKSFIVGHKLVASALITAIILVLALIAWVIPTWITATVVCVVLLFGWVYAIVNLIVGWDE